MFNGAHLYTHYIWLPSTRKRLGSSTVAPPLPTVYGLVKASLRGYMRVRHRKCVLLCRFCTSHTYRRLD